ncbi:MAG: hypothetical protein JST26_15915 [Bacteroidetes bacterium]|nr:hypothetical protein [Bacteroidota bacterium]
MKKLFTTVAAVTIAALSLTAQTKEGYVIYDTKIEGLPPEQAAMGEMETKVYFKDGKSMTEVNSMMYSMQTVMDDKGMLMLMDQMGNKFAVKQTKEEMEKEAAANKDKEKEPKIEYTTETKTIAGYECKKAIVTTYVGKDKKEEKVDVWYCEKFDNPNKQGAGRGGSLYKGLKGMPFEYSMNQNGLKINVVAKEVSTDPVSDSKFVLSTDGYKMMTMEELKAMGKGGK